MALREIRDWQAMGTPDDSEIYADSGSILLEVLRCMDRQSEKDCIPPLTTGQAVKVQILVQAALNRLADDGLIQSFRSDNLRPLEWQFTPLGDAVFLANSVQRSCINERPI